MSISNYQKARDELTFREDLEEETEEIDEDSEDEESDLRKEFE